MLRKQTNRHKDTNLNWQEDNTRIKHTLLTTFNRKRQSIFLIDSVTQHQIISRLGT